MLLLLLLFLFLPGFSSSSRDLCKAAVSDLASTGSDPSLRSVDLSQGGVIARLSLCESSGCILMLYIFWIACHESSIGSDPAGLADLELRPGDKELA